VQYVFLDPDAFLEIRVVKERRVRGSEQVTEADLEGAFTVTDIVDPRTGIGLVGRMGGAHGAGRVWTALARVRV